MDKKHVFTHTEKTFFTDILKKYSSVIENRNTDSASLRKKNETWGRLTAEFNSSPLATNQASTKQLRRLWVNLKQRQREALAKKREHRLSSGGGLSVICDAQTDPDASATAHVDGAVDSDTAQEVSPMDVPSMPVSVEISVEPDVIIPMDDHVYSQPFSTMQLSPTSTPPPSTLRTTTPPPSTFRNTSPPSALRTAQSKMIIRNNVVEREYKDRLKRANEKHNIEMLILKEQLRESKAKADLAELILKQKLDS